MHRNIVMETENTYTKIQSSTMGLEMALCSVIVDGFLMKSGAVCLPYATHVFQPHRHRVGENKTKQRQKGSIK